MGVSRKPPASPIDDVTYLQADLADQATCVKALASAGATHLFYCGRATHAEQTLESAGDDSEERFFATLDQYRQARIFQ